MDTNQLTTLLHDATDDLEPRAGFTNAVLRGGRRRQLRHRIAVATSAAAALTLVTGGAYVVFGDATSQVAAGPTQGDLAGDQQFLDSAIRAWEAGKARSPNSIAGIFDDVRGAPEVYWAGTTPAGRAAVVTQQVYLQPHENLPDTAANTEQTLVGLVATDPADGQFKLVTDQFQAKPTDPKPGYFQFGPGNRTLLAVARDRPLFETHSATGEPNPTREERMELFNPMPFKDGVAILHLDYDFPQAATVIEGPDPLVDNPVRLPILLATDYLAAAAAGGTGPVDGNLVANLEWSVELTVGSPGGPAVDPTTKFNEALMARSPEGGVTSLWHIRAGLADGRVAIVGNHQVGTGVVARIYAVLVNPDLTTQVIEGAVVNKHSALPVKLRLPDGQGWVIANNGKQLKYRTAPDGPWQDAGTSAALVPDGTVQVMVGSTIVDLPR